MLATSTRLLRLLSLLQKRPDWSGAELADRLGVSDRTIRRDIERLRDLDYPVHAVRGVAGYRLGAGAALPPLLLEDEEAVAVAVGLRTAAAGVSGIEEASLGALAKLEQLLPTRLRAGSTPCRRPPCRCPATGPVPGWTRPCWACWPPPAATASGCAWPTGTTTARPAGVPWSPTGW